MDNLKKQFITYLEKELKKVKIKFRNMRDEVERIDLDGVYSPSSNTIWVNKKIKNNKKYLKEVILHEMFEWMLWKLFKNTRHYWDVENDKGLEYNETYYVIKHADIDKIVGKILEIK